MTLGPNDIYIVITLDLERPTSETDARDCGPPI
jgi:hypothetical protein